MPARKKKARSRRRPAARKSVRKKSAAAAKPPSTLSIAVTLPSPKHGVGPTKFAARMTASLAEEFKPDPTVRSSALAELQRLGFKVTSQGRMTISVRGSRSLFERTFGTKLSAFVQRREMADDEAFFFPAKGAPWKPHSGLAAVIDDAYIQWPHIYMTDLFKSTEPSPIPPRVDYHHLRVAGDLNWLLNVDKVHRQGTTGRGVRVAMIDSGFAHKSHPHFGRRGYRTTTVLAPGATDVDKDGSSHGTGESANLLAVAPDVEFIGVKLDNERGGKGASVHEGFLEAIQHNPHVISVSIGFDMCPSDLSGRRTSNQHLTELPNSLKALEAEIQAAVADGTVVVFSAGNGHVAFPGMMPDVISAGGAFVDDKGALKASDYASGFVSKIYAGRVVPDFCGLVGMQPHADYIMLPVQAKSRQDGRGHDKTADDDGWGVFSGTSAAAPQIAGICALLLQKSPGLSPADVKSVLSRTAVDVTTGNANPLSNEDKGGEKAKVGPDAATGTGLIDAFEAWKLV